MADMGQRVVAIEGDLRAPAFAGLLGLDSEAGLGEILDGSATLDDTLVEIGSQREGGASAWALPAGPPTPLPQPLLAGNRMRAVVAHARQRADVVIISGPPAATSGDSLALAVLAQRVLLVARLDVSRRDDVAHAVQALDDPDGRLVGAVATTGPAARLSPADLAHLARRRPHLGASWRRAAPDARANGAGGAAVEREEVTVR
jgi:Mrp family chromosome partitioning ATPase